jgi:hypothetical protein
MANKNSKVRNEQHRKELKKTMNGQPVNSSYYIKDSSGNLRKNPEVEKTGPRRATGQKGK